MTRLILLVSLCFIGIYLNADTDSCSNQSFIWTSENEALKVLEQMKFKSTESILNEGDNWVQSAQFYTCNSQSGFLIVKTANSSKVHQGVPASLWEELKDAKCKSGFYSMNIKNKFKIDLYK